MSFTLLQRESNSWRYTFTLSCKTARPCFRFDTSCWNMLKIEATVSRLVLLALWNSLDFRLNNAFHTFCEIANYRSFKFFKFLAHKHIKVIGTIFCVFSIFPASLFQNIFPCIEHFRYKMNKSDHYFNKYKNIIYHSILNLHEPQLIK